VADLSAGTSSGTSPATMAYATGCVCLIARATLRIAVRDDLNHNIQKFFLQPCRGIHGTRFLATGSFSLFSAFSLIFWPMSTG